MSKFLEGTAGHYSASGTFLKSRHIFKIKGYQIERLDRQNDMTGGVLTRAKEGLAYSSSITS